MRLRNHENFKKMKHKNFTLGVFVRGVLSWGFCPRTQRGYKFVLQKMFSGIKSDFSLVLLNFRGQISNRNDSFHSGKEMFVMSYL